MDETSHTIQRRCSLVQVLQMHPPLVGAVSVNAKNVDEDAANHFLVEKDQDGIKISINHQESEITEQRISQSPTNEITQKNGVILHYRDVYNKRVRTSKVKDFIGDEIQNDSYFLIGKNCQNFCLDLGTGQR